MLRNDYGIIFPKEIEEVYDEFVSITDQTHTFCYNWEGGTDGCYLSVICTTNPDKTVTLITTRNHEAVRKSSNPKSKKYFSIVSPAGYRIEHIEIVPAGMSICEYLLRHHSQYAETVEITEENKYLLDTRDVHDSAVWTSNIDGKEVTYLASCRVLTDIWTDFYDFYKKNYIDQKVIARFDFSKEYEKFYQMLKDRNLYETFEMFNNAMHPYIVKAEVDPNRKQYCDGCILIGKKGCLGRQNYLETGETGVVGCTKYTNVAQHKLMLHHKRLKDLPYKYLCVYYNAEDEKLAKEEECTPKLKYPLSKKMLIAEKTEAELMKVVNDLLARHGGDTVDKGFIKDVNGFYGDPQSSRITIMSTSKESGFTFYKF